MVTAYRFHFQFTKVDKRLKLEQSTLKENRALTRLIDYGTVRQMYVFSGLFPFPLTAL